MQTTIAANAVDIHIIIEGGGYATSEPEQTPEQTLTPLITSPVSDTPTVLSAILSNPTPFSSYPPDRSSYWAWTCGTAPGTIATLPTAPHWLRTNTAIGTGGADGPTNTSWVFPSATASALQNAGAQSGEVTMLLISFTWLIILLLRYVLG